MEQGKYIDNMVHYCFNIYNNKSEGLMENCVIIVYLITLMLTSNYIDYNDKLKYNVTL